MGLFGPNTGAVEKVRKELIEDNVVKKLQNAPNALSALTTALTYSTNDLRYKSANAIVKALSPVNGFMAEPVLLVNCKNLNTSQTRDIFMELKPLLTTNSGVQGLNLQDIETHQKETAASCNRISLEQYPGTVQPHLDICRYLKEQETGQPSVYPGVRSSYPEEQQAAIILQQPRSVQRWRRGGRTKKLKKNKKSKKSRKHRTKKTRRNK